MSETMKQTQNNIEHYSGLKFPSLIQQATVELMRRDFKLLQTTHQIVSKRIYQRFSDLIPFRTI